MSNIHRKNKSIINKDIKLLSTEQTNTMLASITDTGDLGTVWGVIQSLGYRVVVSGKTLTMYDNLGGSYSVLFGEDIQQQQLRDALRFLVRSCSEQKTFFYTDDDKLKAKVSVLYGDGYIGGAALLKSNVGWGTTYKHAMEAAKKQNADLRESGMSPFSATMRKALNIINVLHEGGVGTSYQEAKSLNGWTSLRIYVKNVQRFEMVVPVSFNLSSIVADQKRLLSSPNFDENFLNAVLLAVRELNANWAYIH